VLEALLRRVGQVGVALRVGTRVTGIEATGEGFRWRFATPRRSWPGA